MKLENLPNIKKVDIDNGYLNIELIDGDLIRLNFNDVKSLKKQLRIASVSVSAYMVICEPDGKRLAVIAESIGDACDKLDENGYFDYQFIRSVSFDVLH